ncbi:galactose-1-phosphate uridylyltransferase [Neorhodopirellula pilleata]|uniref:Galactose-1-phosphate uridylyltransferase n=1 Tax=Neorhodopirellula pilleata TaxID=2714738 RepID=A0A5C6A688_9BACT|nr:DUF4921 family protein [Neorhodopirellula pilleata]TWT94895.1 Galactose-1-phosphate uridylyltransferase [Neorhodopirellula pilleata]
MAISRVELRADRLSRRRDSRSLRVSRQTIEPVDNPADTIAGIVIDTEPAPPHAPSADRGATAATASGTKGYPKYQTSDASGAMDERLRREMNLTRSLNEEKDRERHQDHLASPHTKKTIVSSPEATPTRPTTSDNELEQPVAVDPLIATSGVSLNAEVLSSHGPIATDSIQAEKRSESSVPTAGQSRMDLITGEWTLYATTRSQRPDQFANIVVKPPLATDCPFCCGQEHRTPNPVWSAKLDDDDEESGDWSVRVVPNLYPAVTHDQASVENARDRNKTGDEELPSSARRRRTMEAGRLDSVSFGAHADAIFKTSVAPQSPLRKTELFPCEPATGGHEVIIESPRHTESFSELNTAEMALVFAAYAERIRHWQTVAGIHHVSIFKNVGRDAGASLQHSHSQLIATSRIPTVVQQVTRRLQAHYARTGSCLQCDLVRGEIQDKTRLVSQTDSFVAYCPYASRFPLQVRLTSKEHLACFSELRPNQLSEVSRLVLRVVRWLEALRPGTAYNVLLHTCPVKFDGDRQSQHWALDIFPRLSRLAGFELATGAMINPMYPETAAKAFREQARLSDPRYVLR